MSDDQLTEADLAAIVERHRYTSPHIKARQTWKDMDSLLDEVRRLKSQLATTYGVFDRQSGRMIQDRIFHEIDSAEEFACQMAQILEREVDVRELKTPDDIDAKPNPKE